MHVNLKYFYLFLLNGTEIACLHVKLKIGKIMSISALFQTTRSKPLADKAIAARVLQQDVISSNLANIDTPFYKAKGVRFEDALIKSANKLYKNEQTLPLALTNKNHISSSEQSDIFKPTIYLRDGHMARNDANTVDIDVETSELSKNTIMINALTQALKKYSAIFKSVIDASSKV